MAHVFQDYREAAVLRLSIPHTEVELPFDYLVVGNGLTIAVERKTLADLLASISDGRLFNQAEAMQKAVVGNGIGIILGEPFYYGRQGVVIVPKRGPTSWTWKHILGAQLALLSLQCALVVVPAGEVPQAIAHIAQWADTTEPFTAAWPKRSVRYYSPQVRALAAIPGIGPVLATAILDYYGSFIAAVSDYPNWAFKVPGMGKQRQQLVNTFMLAPDQPEEEGEANE